MSLLVVLQNIFLNQQVNDPLSVQLKGAIDHLLHLILEKFTLELIQVSSLFLLTILLEVH